MAFCHTKELIDRLFVVADPEISERQPTKGTDPDPKADGSGMYIDAATFFGLPSGDDNRPPIGIYYSRRPVDEDKKTPDNKEPTKNSIIKTGFAGLDKLLGELEAGSHTLIAGLPGVGKTSLALNIATHAATETNTPVAFFSFEIGREELLTRLISAHSRVNLDSIYSGFITPAERKDLDATLDSLYHAPIHIDDDPFHSVASIKEQIKKYKTSLDLKLLVIDCLQLIKNAGRSEKALRGVSSELKNIAREFSIAIISIYQLPQSWQSKKIIPHPSFILGHGAAEKYNADKIILIYRRSVCRQCHSPIELCTCSLDHDTRLIVYRGKTSQDVTHLRFLTDSVHFETPAC